jgi:hypothetical protein
MDRTTQELPPMNPTADQTITITADKMGAAVAALARKPVEAKTELGKRRPRPFTWLAAYNLDHVIAACRDVVIRCAGGRIGVANNEEVRTTACWPTSPCPATPKWRSRAGPRCRGRMRRRRSRKRGSSSSPST